jgi:hypothetical protein
VVADDDRHGLRDDLALVERETVMRILTRIIWGVVLALCVVRPVSAQTIPADFHAWFLEHVAGKPFGQQTLLDLAPLLPCVGSQITPPNAVGERTKIWDPTTFQWTRVGFGEGQWVWIGQGVSTPPTPQPCGAAPTPTPSPTPTPGPPPSVDLEPLRQELNAAHALIAQMLNRNEELAKADRDAIAALSAQLTAHDNEPSWIRKFSTSPIGVAIYTFLGTALTAWQVTK